MKFELGIYKHTKSGKLYRVLGVARHSESLEEFVVYQALYYDSEFGNQPIWVRPLSMFTSEVEVDGKKVARFVLVTDYR